VVDTRAPDVTVADADGDSVPTFTPNGDGSRDTISFGVGSSEPGSVIGAVDGDGFASHIHVGVASSGATLTWDGRKDGGGYVPDGRYVVAIAARDRAGNVGAAQERTVEVYGALADVAASRAVFYPQDGDGLGRSTTLSFRLAPTPL
jgi:hypothetical protein